jgi:glycerophosphoryl diester phosphodiesterase
LTKQPLIVAHKGASAYLLGNTLPAFNLAIRQGADCIELDVQLTGDEHIIVYDQWYVEDGDSQRPVIQLPLSHIRQLWSRMHEAASQVSPSDLLTLQDVLSYLKSTDVEVMIELKNSRLLQPLDFAQRVIDELDLFHMSSRAYLFSFDHELIAATKATHVRRGILYVGRLVDIPGILRATRADFIETRNDFLDFKLVAQLHQLGVQVCGWSTVDRREINRLLSLRVDMVTTDAPDVARRIIDGA